VLDRQITFSNGGRRLKVVRELEIYLVVLFVVLEEINIPQVSVYVEMSCHYSLLIPAVWYFSVSN